MSAFLCPITLPHEASRLDYSDQRAFHPLSELAKKLEVTQADIFYEKRSGIVR
jgi:hypothetical protein